MSRRDAIGPPHISPILQHYFDALHNCDVDAFHRMWHPQGRLVGLSPIGDIVVQDAETFCAGVVARSPSNTEEFTKWDRIVSVSVLDETMAYAKVQIALPLALGSPTPTTEPTLYTDLLVLLHDPILGMITDGYRCTSRVSIPFNVVRFVNDWHTSVDERVQ